MAILKPKELSRLGLVDNAARSLALNIISKHYKHHDKYEIESVMMDLIRNPNCFLEDTIWSSVAKKMIGKSTENEFKEYDTLKDPNPLKIYGSKHIESAAKQQMDWCVKLPVSVGGALMADAHAGFGMPIGGVLATNNAVIPYAVGQDIGCRMMLSIIGENEKFINRNSFAMKTVLKNYTHFGMNGHLDFQQEHAILDDSRFGETELLRKAFPKAAYQLGSSGGGNHFVEFGSIDLQTDNVLGLPKGNYIGLLSHSGSRGLGATIAQYYTQLAMNTCKLPRQAQPLAWLDLDTEAGQGYWLSMQLAGDYAKACHEQIHHNVLKALGLESIAIVENHHNFAWKEQDVDGNEVIVHRKGATPAHQGELGIIPSNMVDAAYIVSGKGNAMSWYSASHGSGRQMSRQRAKESLTVSELKKLLSQKGITLLGGTVEEHPSAYKNIDDVMLAQKELVNIEGRFFPKIVRMNKE